MSTRIANFDNGTYLEFDTGNFDDYCVYIYASDGTRKAPLDSDYFADLRELANRHSTNKVWKDFLGLYNITTKKLEMAVARYIETTTEAYGSDSQLMKRCLYILYAGMIAENNKLNTKLGKRIKRLGLHTLLIDGKSIDYSVSFMRGMSWKDIDLLCKSKGF